MKITVRNVGTSGEYKDASVAYGNMAFGLGYLSAEQRMELSVELLGAVYNLVGKDFETHAEFVQWALENLG